MSALKQQGSVGGKSFERIAKLLNRGGRISREFKKRRAFENTRREGRLRRDDRISHLTKKGISACHSGSKTKTAFVLRT